MEKFAFQRMDQQAKQKFAEEQLVDEQAFLVISQDWNLIELNTCHLELFEDSNCKVVQDQAVAKHVLVRIRIDSPLELTIIAWMVRLEPIRIN